MKRRQFVIGLLIFAVVGSDQATSNGGNAEMTSGPPDKIRLVPDKWHLAHVGRLAGGSLFWMVSQLYSIGGATKDYVCTFIFDQDGRLIEHSIELIGVRGSYASGSVGKARDRHIAGLGDYSVADIWVRPFSVESDRATFGLVPRQTNRGQWRVEFMPGNTLSFYPPWEAGEYDT